MSRRSGPALQFRRCVAGGPADQRAHPRQHLFDMVGLGDIIVGAGVDTGNLVAPAIARRQHQHRHVAAVPPPTLDDADPVHLRQADIETISIVGLGVAEKMALFAVKGTIDHIAGIVKASESCRFRSLSSSTTNIRIQLFFRHPKNRQSIRSILSHVNRRTPVSILWHHEFRPAGALPIFPWHEHDNHADRLPSLCGGAGLGKRAAILGSDLLADGIAIRGGNEEAFIALSQTGAATDCDATRPDRQNARAADRNRERVIIMIVVFQEMAAEREMNIDQQLIREPASPIGSLGKAKRRRDSYATITRSRSVAYGGQEEAPNQPRHSTA